MKMTYYFKTRAGKIFSATAYDPDRARCAAKRNAGDEWEVNARLVRVTNAL